MIGRIIGVLEHEPRTVVSIYYPSEAGTMIAGLDLYAPCRAEAEEVLGELGVETGRLAVADPFVEEGSFAIARDRLPVILLAPGFGVERDMYQGLVANLVPQRYVVVTVGAPGDSVMTVFPDGTFVRQRAEWSRLEPAHDVEWQRLLDMRTDWIVRVLRYLDHVNRQDDILGGRLDLERVAAAGHSLGGAAAYEAAKRDDRIKSAVMLDPSFHLVRRDGRPAVPTLVLRQEASSLEAMTAAGGLSAEIARAYIEGQRHVAASAGTLMVRVTGSNHMSFSDVPYHYGDDHAAPVHAAAARCVGRFLASVFAGDVPDLEPNADVDGVLVPIDADGEPRLPVPIR